MCRGGGICLKSSGDLDARCKRRDFASRDLEACCVRGDVEVFASLPQELGRHGDVEVWMYRGRL